MVEKSGLDDIISRGIDLKNRRIYFGMIEDQDGGDIAWNTVEITVRALSKMSLDYPKKPIEIHMSSGGGEVYAALRLYDAIQACPCQIKFFGSGQIMSSAVWIMAGCDERTLDPNTVVMIHDGSVESLDQNHTDRQIDSAEGERLNIQMFKLLSDNSRLPTDFWLEVSQRDVYLTAEEAILLGLADRISESKKRGNLRKSRSYGLAQTPDKKDLSKLVRSLYKRIHKTRQVTTNIQIHTPKEQYDNSLTIDDSPVPEDSDDIDDISFVDPTKNDEV